MAMCNYSGPQINYRASIFVIYNELILLRYFAYQTEKLNFILGLLSEWDASMQRVPSDVSMQCLPPTFCNLVQHGRIIFEISALKPA